MSIEDVWNRAAMQQLGSLPAPGDRALADLLRLHSLVMSGGVLHALEMCTPDEVAAAAHGFSYFELEEAADVLRWVQDEAKSHDPDGEFDFWEALELDANARYDAAVPTDAVIGAAFRADFERRPENYQSAQ